MLLGDFAGRPGLGWLAVLTPSLKQVWLAMYTLPTRGQQRVTSPMDASGYN